MKEVSATALVWHRVVTIFTLKVPGTMPTLCLWTGCSTEMPRASNRNMTSRKLHINCKWSDTQCFIGAQTHSACVVKCPAILWVPRHTSHSTKFERASTNSVSSERDYFLREDLKEEAIFAISFSPKNKQSPKKFSSEQFCYRRIITAAASHGQFLLHNVTYYVTQIFKMSSTIVFITVIALCASRFGDAASLRDIARDVRSDRVTLDAGLHVTVPQSRSIQKVDLSRLDVPTGICFEKMQHIRFLSCCVFWPVNRCLACCLLI